MDQDTLLVVGLGVLAVGLVVVAGRRTARASIKPVVEAWNRSALDGGAALSAALSTTELSAPESAALVSALRPDPAARRVVEKLLARGYERLDAEPEAADADEPPAWMIGLRNLAELHGDLFEDLASAEFHLEHAETLRAPAARAEALSRLEYALLSLPDETLPAHLVRRIAALADDLRDEDLPRVASDAASVVVMAQASAPEEEGRRLADARLRLRERCRRARSATTDEETVTLLDLAIDQLEEDESDEDP